MYKAFRFAAKLRQARFYLIYGTKYDTILGIKYGRHDMEFENIRDIAVYGTDCIADISRGSDETCRFVSAKEKYFTVQNENGTLTVTQKTGNIFYRIITKKFEFKLILPKSFDGRLRFRNKNGGLYIKNCNFRDTDLHTLNGVLDLENAGCDELSLKMRNGRIELKKLTVKNGVSVKCANGYVKAEELTSAAFSVSGSNVTLNAADVKTDKFDCSVDNGSFSVSAVDAQDIKLETSNGKIDLLAAGSRDDYRLSLETAHGSVAVDGTPGKNISDPAGADKKITVKTSNGDIDIRFA